MTLYGSEPIAGVGELRAIPNGPALAFGAVCGMAPPLTTERQQDSSEQPDIIAPRVQCFLLKHRARAEGPVASDVGRDITDAYYLDRPEGRIAYSLSGEGPLVICIPGMGDVRSVYRFLGTALADAGFQVAAMDLRGHGDSDVTFNSCDDIAAGTDIVALIEHLGGPAILVGNSMGAGAACWAAAEAPALITGLVLLSPSVRRPEASLFRTIVTQLTELQRWVLQRPRHASRGAAESCIGKVHAPTLIVMGDKDPDFRDPEAEARWIAEQLHGKVLMVPGAGHYLQAEFPEIVSPAVVEFVRRITPSPT